MPDGPPIARNWRCMACTRWASVVMPQSSKLGFTYRALTTEYNLAMLRLYSWDLCHAKVALLTNCGNDLTRVRHTLRTRWRNFTC